MRTVSGLSRQFPNHPDSFLANQTVLSKYMPYRKNFPDCYHATMVFLTLAGVSGYAGMCASRALAVPPSHPLISTALHFSVSHFHACTVSHCKHCETDYVNTTATHSPTDLQLIVVFFDKIYCSNSLNETG